MLQLQRSTICVANIICIGCECLAAMGRRDLARVARRSAGLLHSSGVAVAGYSSSSHAGLLASRGSSIRRAVDWSTPATRDALSRSLASALPARQEETSDEETIRVVGGSGSSPEVVTDHVGAISMLCDDASAQVGPEGRAMLDKHVLRCAKGLRVLRMLSLASRNAQCFFNNVWLLKLALLQ